MPLFKHDTTGTMYLPDALSANDTIRIDTTEQNRNGTRSLTSVTLHIDQLCEIADHLDQLLNPLLADDEEEHDTLLCAHLLDLLSNAHHFLTFFEDHIDYPTLEQIQTAASFAQTGQFLGRGRTTKNGDYLPMVNVNGPPWLKPKHRLIERDGTLVKAPKKFRNPEDTA